jgi:RNA 3'-terminal phosphate cyclase
LITALFRVVSYKWPLRNWPVLFIFSLICGRSPGYGVSLVAETTTGCLLSVDVTVSYPSVDEINEESEKPELTSPEDLGVQAASMLLEEVAQGGVVDSTHQVWAFMQAFYVFLNFAWC